ncbi:MAG: glycoside hydrolase family 88 protein [Bacillota bacterium]|nr:glycoside hydrolase family 88 protein [Bacillota bacterium]
MEGYFVKEESIFEKCGSNIRDAITVIANRYIADNPEYRFTLRAFSKNGFMQMPDGRYDIDFDGKYPNAPLGKNAYAFAMLWCDNECEIDISITFKSPTFLFVNQKLQCCSRIEEERYRDIRRIIKLTLVKGWNSFLIKSQKTPAGFGCIIGSTSGKWCPLHFMSPFNERYGQGGWVYSELTDCDKGLDEENIDAQMSESSTGLKWYPVLEWDDIESQKPVFSRIFGQEAGIAAYGWTKLFILEHSCSVAFVGETSEPVNIWIDNQKVFYMENAGNFEFNINLGHGDHDILVESCRRSEEWGFTLTAVVNGKQKDFKQPCDIKGTDGEWIFLGPFNSPLSIPPNEITDVYRLFDNDGKGVYWSIDKPGFRVRPYLENNLYGKWHYHLGVTLYGLFRVSKLLQREDIKNYTINHAEECIKMYEYSLYDREEYGYQSLNHQLVELDALDDCGSFGAAVIELYRETGEKSFLKVIEKIADYIANRQIRKEDGAFCRGDETIWVDDLYMGNQFLAKYYNLTGKRSYIDDAARQFLLYKKYLYMPEYGVMSHIYDLKYNTPTFVPWGRGNGWALFSLSEVLESLPESHNDYMQLLGFYKELCEGYLKLQGKNGLWHQVLTDPESYEETSCTAMFTYAFAKGVRFGWLDDTERYVGSIYKALEGLMTISIDYKGNVYGVCRGSNFSYSEQYYKNDLLWVTNDTHGIGIVLLAADETIKMIESRR